MNIVVSTPLDLPPLIPSSWELWWCIWNTHAKPLRKTRRTPNEGEGQHVGFDFIKPAIGFPSYAAEFVDLAALDPFLYQQISSLPLTITRARFVMSMGDFAPHTDNMTQSWSIRNMFFCEDPAPQWYYTDADNSNRQDLMLAPNTNWWAYLDGAIKHGTTFNPEHPKIILQLYTPSLQAEEYVRDSIGKFPDQTHSYNISQTIRRKPL